MKPYYEDNSIVLYHGDSYKLAAQLPVGDFLLTDPPYVIAATGGGMSAKKKYLADIDGKVDGGFDIAILERYPNWCVFCGKHQIVELIAAAGDRTWALVTWNKPDPTPLINGNYLPDTEYIVHAYQPGRLFGGYRDKARFIVHPIERNTFGHPTVKPMAVVSKMVRLGTKPGETVVDLFAGSGTTLVAAKMLGRKAIGVEKEERHCETAAKRLAQEMLPLGDEDGEQPPELALPG